MDNLYFVRLSNRYLNFVKGLVPSNDLLLNVNWEDLKKNRVMRLITWKLTRKVLDLLKKLARADDKAMDEARKTNNVDVILKLEREKMEDERKILLKDRADIDELQAGIASDKKTVIADRAFIGSGSVLIAPTTVGEGALTGGGAVVTRGSEIPAGEAWVGVPARSLNRKSDSSTAERP